jgi:hypothetical protein
MTVFWYLIAVRGLAIVPVLLTAVACFLYWKSLARPVMYLFVTCAVLYVLGYVTAHWMLTDIGFAGPAARGGNARVVGIGMSSLWRVVIGYVGFLAVGICAVWFLKRFFGRARGAQASNNALEQTRNG